MTTPNEPLTGIDLAVAVAERVMGWAVAKIGDTHLDPFPVVVPIGDGDRLMIIRFPFATQELWEPWRDPRAWWEVVERMAEKGWRLELYQQSMPWTVRFFKGHPMRCSAASVADGANPGEAVMLAALAAVEKDNGYANT